MRYLITIEAPDVDFDTAGHPRYLPNEIEDSIRDALKHYTEVPNIRVLRFEEAITLNRGQTVTPALAPPPTTKPTSAEVNPNLTKPDALQENPPRGETTPSQNQS